MALLYTGQGLWPLEHACRQKGNGRPSASSEAFDSRQFRFTLWCLLETYKGLGKNQGVLHPGVIFESIQRILILYHPKLSINRQGKSILLHFCEVPILEVKKIKSPASIRTRTHNLLIESMSSTTVLQSVVLTWIYFRRGLPRLSAAPCCSG